MVLYFSATGNTQFIATELAEKLGDECVDLLDRIKRSDLSEIRSEKPFIVCAPVYVCEMPRFLSKYLKRLKLSGNRKVYFIANSAGYSGITGYLAKRLFRKKKMEYMGHTEIIMPRNYFLGRYPPQTSDEIKKRLLSACDRLDETANLIKRGERLRGRHIFMFEKLITIPFNPVWTKYKMPTKDFFATDKCVSCGKCEKLCPMNNISIRDKRPVWGNSCSHCMACVGNCPADAIEYGSATKEKGKYSFRKYKHFLNERKHGEAEKSFSVKKNIPKRRNNG